MSAQADLDRDILNWLRDGEKSAPTDLADEIQRAIAALPRRRRVVRAWLRSPWSTGGLAAAALGVAVVGTVLAMLLKPDASIGPAAKPTPRPSQSVAPTQLPTGLPPLTSAPALPTPEPTYPTARTWDATLGVQLDLTPGWFDKPGSEYLGLAFALDRLHDPDAGVLNILRISSERTSGRFLFHREALGTRSDIGLRLSSIDGTARVADAATTIETQLDGAGYHASPKRLNLSIGKVVQLDWERAFNGPLMYFRTFVFNAGDTIARLDFCTAGSPTPEQAAEFVRIVSSARAAPAP